MDKIDYAIAEGSTVQELEQAVRQYIAEGYEPVGGVAAYTKSDEASMIDWNWYGQTMVRRTAPTITTTVKQTDESVTMLRY